VHKIPNPAILREIKLKKVHADVLGDIEHYRFSDLLYMKELMQSCSVSLEKLTDVHYHKFSTLKKPEGSSLRLQWPDPGLSTETAARLPYGNACGICFPIRELCWLLALISHLSI
jgi:hypothetical protein